MIKKLDMYLWSTTQAVPENIELLQGKLNEVIEEVNQLKYMKNKRLVDSVTLPKINTIPSLVDLNFKQLRINERLTLRQVKEKTGISDSYLSQLENGKIKSPSYNTIKSLVDLYNSNK